MTDASFIIPGREYAANFRQFTAELRSVFSSSLDVGKAEFEISRVFDLFPINVLDDTAGEDLVARGAIEVSSTDTKSGTFLNTGDWILIDFGDDNVGKITIEFDERFAGEFEWEQGPDALVLQFNPFIKVIMDELPAEWGIHRNQRLKSIRIEEDVIDYVFEDSVSIGPETVLRLDLTLDHPTDVNPGSTTLTLLQPSDGGFTGAIIMCGILSCVWCATQGDEEGDEESPERPPPRDTDYVWFADCVTETGGVYSAHFFRNPTWFALKDLDKILNKTATLRYISDRCKPPIPPVKQPVGEYKIRITTTFVDLTLPMPISISGPLV